MTDQEATLWAAVVAAGVSFATLIVSAFSSRGAEQRIATRQALASDLNTIGKQIHETIALTYTFTKASAEMRKEKVQAARDAASKLKDKRTEIRYSLWGLDEGIRTLTRFPDWVSHMKDFPVVTQQALSDGSALGRQLDIAVRDAYLFGKHPSKWRRFRVWAAIRKLKKTRTNFLKRPRTP